MTKGGLLKELEKIQQQRHRYSCRVCYKNYICQVWQLQLQALAQFRVGLEKKKIIMNGDHVVKLKEVLG